MVQALVLVQPVRLLVQPLVLLGLSVHLDVMLLLKGVQEATVMVSCAHVVLRNNASAHAHEIHGLPADGVSPERHIHRRR